MQVISFFRQEEKADGHPPQPKAVKAQMKPFARPAVAEGMAKILVGEPYARYGYHQRYYVNDGSRTRSGIFLYRRLHGKQHQQGNVHQQSPLPPYLEEIIVLIKQAHAHTPHKTHFGEQPARQQRQHRKKTYKTETAFHLFKNKESFCSGRRDGMER